MENTFVLSGLKAKRAELDGELRQTEKRLAALRADLDAIDRAIRVFDPEARPHTIRPKAIRKAAPGFRHGEFSRLVLDVLRDIGGTVSTRDVAEKLAERRGLDISTPHAMELLGNRVRNALLRQRDGIVRLRDGGQMLWRVAGAE